MFTKKLAAFALVGLLAIGGTGITTLAADVDNTTETVNAGMTLEEFKASGMTLEGLKNAKENLDEKGITLEEAKANFSSKIEEYAIAHCITIEEAQAQLATFKESGKTVEGLRNIKAELDEKGVTLEDAKVNFENMLSEYATSKGLTLDEAKAQISQMKENGRTLEGLKKAQDIVGNIPFQN